MGKCSDRKWTSKLRPSSGGPEVDDGVLAFFPEDGSGNFLGEHENTGGLIRGNCSNMANDCSSGSRCHIRLSRKVREGRVLFKYDYEGDFEKFPEQNKYRTVNGTYNITQVGGLALFESGEWIGERPIT